MTPGREVAVIRSGRIPTRRRGTASVLEGNPFTFPEVQTLLDGVTVGGHKISNERQVLNLVEVQRFYFDENKRTARYMMNGHLMSHGIDAISVPARRAREFNTLMVDFYRLKDATRMVAFLTDCHPGSAEIMTPARRDVLDAPA